MKSPMFWAVVIAVTVMQIELAVHSGIAASRRPASPQAKVTTNTATPVVCTGTVCRPSQPSHPQRVIVTPR